MTRGEARGGKEIGPLVRILKAMRFSLIIVDLLMRGAGECDKANEPYRRVSYSWPFRKL